MQIYLIFSLIFSIFFLGCATKQNIEIKDLKTFSQDASYYTKNLKFNYEDIQKSLDKKFNEIFFKPWHIEKIDSTLEDITWHFKYANEKVYGDNLKLISKKWFEKQIDNSNFERFNTFLRKAIVVKNSNLRVFPTNSKIFKDPSKAGEGFPFDYNQNSGIKLNTPILISHFSKDRAWVYVASSFAKGWLKVTDIAYVDEKIINTFENGNYFIAVKDDFPVLKKGVFIEYIKLGTLFSKKNDKYLSVGRYENNHGFLRTLDISYVYLAKKPLNITNENIAKIANELLGEPYGWGELLEHRDCSAFTKDFYAPFGIDLNRNSFGQTFNGKYYDLEKLSIKEKEEFFIKNGVPFFSLAYMSGHVMIYVGVDKGKALFMHNVWGVKTKDFLGNDKRNIVGSTIIASLDMGSELVEFDESRSLGNRLIGMVNLFEEPNRKEN